MSICQCIILVILSSFIGQCMNFTAARSRSLLSLPGTGIGWALLACFDNIFLFCVTTGNFIWYTFSTQLFYFILVRVYIYIWFILLSVAPLHPPSTISITSLFLLLPTIPSFHHFPLIYIKTTVYAICTWKRTIIWVSAIKVTSWSYITKASFGLEFVFHCLSLVFSVFEEHLFAFC